jgi:hypothetical protein
MGKSSEALDHLGEAMKLNTQLLAKSPGWRDLRTQAQKDPAFAGLRAMSNYQKLVGAP